MRASETVHAEPRDSIDSPNYRVNFWTPGQGWALDAHVLTEVTDVAEVLTWVHENAAGRRFEVFAELNPEPVGAFQAPRTAGLLRLVGSNPNAGDTVLIGTFVKE